LNFAEQIRNWRHSSAIYVTAAINLYILIEAPSSFSKAILFGGFSDI